MHLGSLFHQSTQGGRRLTINGNIVLLNSDGIALISENA